MKFRKLKREPDLRRSASERGYDWQWTKLAKQYKAQHPLCEHCLLENVSTPTQIVDHKRPIIGPNDPGRLDWSNLQSLCRPHHKRKTDGETLGAR